MGALAITAIGDDRPGIVAAVTEVLVAVDANLEDTSMTILRGHFAMMLIVGCDRPAAEVEAAVAPVAAELDLVVSVREVATVPPAAAAGAHYVVTVHGADRPGIVARISRVIAAHGGNVTDLVTRLAGNLYVLTVEIDLPSAQAAEALRPELAVAAADLDVVAGLHPADDDVL
jgi:glycine cleavage system transcriptional repressor